MIHLLFQALSDLCLVTVNIVVSILAAEAANLALKVLATRGAYIAGGVALHVLEALRNPVFLRTFTNDSKI